jgi:hypothetical protein
VPTLIWLPNGILLVLHYAQKKFINYPHHPVNASGDSNRDLGV